jgi:hypothetical protein
MSFFSFLCIFVVVRSDLHLNEIESIFFSAPYSHPDNLAAFGPPGDNTAITQPCYRRTYGCYPRAVKCHILNVYGTLTGALNILMITKLCISFSFFVDTRYHQLIAFTE